MYVLGSWKEERILNLLYTIFYVSFFTFFILFVIYIYYYQSTFIGISIFFVTRAEKNTYALNFFYLIPLCFFILKFNSKKFFVKIISILILFLIISFAILYAARQVWLSIFLSFIIVSLIKYKNYKISFNIILHSLLSLVLFLLLAINLPKNIVQQEWWLKVYNTINLNQIIENIDVDKSADFNLLDTTSPFFSDESLSELQNTEVESILFKKMDLPSNLYIITIKDKIYLWNNEKCNNKFKLKNYKLHFYCFILKTHNYIFTSFNDLNDSYKISSQVLPTKKEDNSNLNILEGHKKIFSKNNRNKLIKNCYDVYLVNKNYFFGNGPFTCSNSHNEYVNVLSSFGFFGLFIFIVILFLIIIHSIKFRIIKEKYKISKKETLEFVLAWSLISFIINLYFAQMFFSSAFVTYTAIFISLYQKLRKYS